MNKKIAVYMDHFAANILEYTDAAKIVKIIKSGFNKDQKEKILQSGESLLYHKEQNLQKEFYAKLRAELLNYESVLLFGATNAKTELLNILQIDAKFLNVEFTLKNTDKLTDKEQVNFVNDCFYIS
jgi:Lhr-like helicase